MNTENSSTIDKRRFPASLDGHGHIFREDGVHLSFGRRPDDRAFADDLVQAYNAFFETDPEAEAAFDSLLDRALADDFRKRATAAAQRAGERLGVSEEYRNGAEDAIILAIYDAFKAAHR